MKQLVAATSVGIVGRTTLLDLCYEEGSRAEVDINVVMTGDGAPHLSRDSSKSPLALSRDLVLMVTYPLWF